MTILRGFLKKYKELVESPQFLDRGDRPKSIEEIPKETLEGLKEIFIKALQNILPTLTSERIEITDYDPFEAAIASKVVGTLDINLGHLVVKVGNESLNRQANFISSFQKTPFENFFPQVYQVDQMQHREFAYFMEHLKDFCPLHDLIFLRTVDDSIEATNKVFNVLTDIYKSYAKPGAPNLQECYIERITTRVKEAMEKFEQVTITTECYFPDILEKPIYLDEDEKLLPYKNVIKLIEKADLDACAPSFTTVVHGDAHPGNIMFENNSFSNFKFIDPNGDLPPTDYMYDMGKFFHWIDLYGFIALEKEIKKELIAIDVSKVTDGLKVTLDFSHLKSNLGNERLLPLRAELLRLVEERCKTFSENFKDPRGQMRFHLSVASAYLGGLVHQSEKTHLVSIFVKGLKHLNAFLVQSGIK